MSRLCLESNENSTEITIIGDVQAIFSNRRAARYIKDTLKFRSDVDRVTVEVSEDVNQTIDHIKKICDYISAELVFSDKVSETVSNYALEEEKFHEFAEKARAIRNNECNTEEFSAFTEAVKANLKNRTLYPLQLLSSYHLAFSQNGCNFSVPGAGKTSVVYGAFAYLSSLNPDDIKYVDKLLIVAPLSAFGPWELEYEECFGEKPSTKRLNGKIDVDEKKLYLYSKTPAKITLLSYNSVLKLQEELAYFLQNNKVMVVLDEAHKIKNTNGGATAMSVLSLAQNCRARVILTGTPAPNGYEDLYNLYKFIWPTKKIIRYSPGQLKDMSRQQSDFRVPELLDTIAPFFIRVKKSDLHIPAATEHPPIIVPMGEAQRRIYDIIERRYMGDIVSSRERRFRQDLIKARLIRLMQAATNPNLLSVPLRDFSETVGVNPDSVGEDSSLIRDIMQYTESEIPAKFIKAKELIEQIIERGEKVVVWAIFIKNILEFNEYLSQNGIASKMLYGATPISNDEDLDDEDEDEVETREKIISEFNRDDSSFKVIIANPFAVSESISLHKACHNAIYMERSFNAAHFIQSKDRIHRYGLKEGVQTNYYYLISENSIDSVINDRLIMKESRLNEIMESMPIPLFSNVELDTGDEDIKAIIAAYANRTKTM